jgi:hypothetical protein
MTRRHVSILILCLLAIGITFSPGAANSDSNPPPDWTSSDWAALSATKQAGELELYPSYAGYDSQTKLTEVQQNPNPGPDPQAIIDAQADGPGTDYTPGIFNSAQSPLDKATYQVNNSWSGLNQAGTTLLLAFAGKNVQSGQSVIVVQDVPWPRPNDEDESDVTTTAYPSSCGDTGPLNLTAGDNTSLSYSDSASPSHNGNFNLTTRTYTC